MSDAILLIISAKEEDFETDLDMGQTKDLLQIILNSEKKFLVVGVNKMDDESVNYS